MILFIYIKKKDQTVTIMIFFFVIKSCIFNYFKIIYRVKTQFNFSLIILLKYYVICLNSKSLNLLGKLYPRCLLYKESRDMSYFVSARYNKRLEPDKKKYLAVWPFWCHNSSIDLPPAYYNSTCIFSMHANLFTSNTLNQNQFPYHEMFDVFL